MSNSLCTKGFFFNLQNSTERWRIILLILASLYIIGNIAYTVCGSHERQFWDHNNKRHIGHLNVLMGRYFCQAKVAHF